MDVIHAACLALIPSRLFRCEIFAKRRHDGGATVAPDGVGGWEVVAPAGFCWSESETTCQVLPMSEYEDKEDRQELLRATLESMMSGLHSIVD